MTDFTVVEFFKRFQNDDVCIGHLMAVRHGMKGECPKCHQETTWHRIKKLPAYGCQWCGHHVHPMAGTPFEKSRTPLQKWFYAIYLFTTSRHGVPAKELQRQLGVTYKCAWRMGHEIRKYMANVDGDGPLGGHVEMDETFIGGNRNRFRARGNPGGDPTQEKAIVFGMVERKGPIYTAVIPHRSRKSVGYRIKQRVPAGTIVSTDEAAIYRHLKGRYNHGTVCHEYEEYVNGIHHTNTIEGFWSRLKNSIRGTHIHVSKRHLAKYLGEFEYRYNMRGNPTKMFDRLLVSF